MALVPGTNSYVTVTEADAYVSAFFDASARAQWSERTDEQKAAMLEYACTELESLPFIGRKRDPQQALMFPRWPVDSVPNAIRYAQIEIAASPLDAQNSKSMASAARRAQLQQQGVTSFSIDDLSESYGGNRGAVADFPFLAVARISRLLRPWLNGGYAVC